MDGRREATGTLYSARCIAAENLSGIRYSRVKRHRALANSKLSASLINHAAYFRRESRKFCLGNRGGFDFEDLYLDRKNLLFNGIIFFLEFLLFPRKNVQDSKRNLHAREFDFSKMCVTQGSVRGGLRWRALAVSRSRVVERIHSNREGPNGKGWIARGCAAPQRQRV